MFQHILIATDGSSMSDNAIAAGVKLASLLRAKLTGVTAIEPYPYSTLSGGGETPEAYNQRTHREAAMRLAKIETAAAAHSATVNAVIKEDAQPHRAIIDAANEYGCDLIFMASHGRHGLQAVLLGSETQKVLALSKIPVIVYR
jgi:nucleotide-binding universal stress UspA family protein